MKEKGVPINAVLMGNTAWKRSRHRMPAIIGKEGIDKIIEYDLTDEELTKLRELANILKSIAKNVELIP